MLYKRPGAVDINLPRHMQWHKVARRLLGLPPAQFPAPDYVTSFCVWEPDVLRAMLARIEQVTGQAWMDAVTGERTFSEWTLYGIFAEEMMKYEKEALTESSLCHSYWGTVPLTFESAASFISGMNPDDVAILIQSKTLPPGCGPGVPPAASGVPSAPGPGRIGVRGRLGWIRVHQRLPDARILPGNVTPVRSWGG
jgi:hypothetical protein